MPLLPSQKNSTAVIKSFRDNLLSRTDITSFDRDSKSRALSDGLVQEITAYRQEVGNAFDMNQLASARGQALIDLGLRYGVEPLPVTFAEVTPEERSLAFFVDSGTFGDINGAASITIPAGTVVTSQANSNELGAVVRYRTEIVHTLSAASSVGYIAAKAVVSGGASNVGAGVLRLHNFTSYTDSTNNTLKVVNFFPVLNGRDQEPPDRYRSRIANHYLSLLQNNETKIRLSGLQVPGVVDIKVISGYFGIGTVAAIVLGAENQSSPGLVAAVQDRIDQYQGPAGYAQAAAATQVSLDFDLELKLSKGLTEAEKQRVETDIKKTLMRFLGDHSIGSVVSLDTAARQIQQRVTGIVAMRSRLDRESLFKVVYRRKGVSGVSLSERQKVIVSTITLGEDEYVAAGEINVTFVE